MELETLMHTFNARNPFCQKLGISVEELRPGYARAVKTVTQEDTNPLGVPHGGLYFTLADNACGFAIGASGNAAVTINSTFHFMRGAKVGDHLSAEAFEVKSGKTILIYEARISDQNGALLGSGTFTFFRLEQKPKPHY